jgi:arylformamidase
VAADRRGELQPEDLPARTPDRVLFKTANSRHWTRPAVEFDRHFVAVGIDLARELVARGAKLVGLDYLGIEAFAAKEGHPVHRTFLEAGVAVVEGLDLSAVQPGEYELWCLPVKLVGSDGAPARCVLVEP